MKTGPASRSTDIKFLRIIIHRSTLRRCQKWYHSIPTRDQQEVMIQRSTRTLFGFTRLGSGSGLGLRFFCMSLLCLPCSLIGLLFLTFKLPLPIFPLRQCQNSLVSEEEDHNIPRASPWVPQPPSTFFQSLRPPSPSQPLQLGVDDYLTIHRSATGYPEPRLNGLPVCCIKRVES